MNRHVPVSGVVVLGVISLVSVLAFLLFNQAFGGPGSQVGQTGYELTVKMHDTGQLLQKSLVMVNGVKVGEVTKVETDQDGSKVTFTVNEDYRPVRRGGTATLGRTHGGLCHFLQRVIPHARHNLRLYVAHNGAHGVFAMLGARLVTGESRMLATSSAGKYFTRQLANPTSDWRVVGLKERVSETLTLTSNCR